MLRIMFGRSASTSTARVMARMFGAREVVLGVGTITSVKEHTQDAEWVSACGGGRRGRRAGDGVQPGRAARSRPAALVGATAAVLGMQAAARVRRRARAAKIEAAIVDATVGR